MRAASGRASCLLVLALAGCSAEESAPYPGHEALVLPCVSHALICIREPDLRLLGEDDLGRHVDPAVPAEVVRFLEAHGGAG